MSREQDDLDQLKYIQEWTKKQAQKRARRKEFVQKFKNKLKWWCRKMKIYDGIMGLVVADAVGVPVRV